MKKSKIPRNTLYVSWSAIFDCTRNKYDTTLFMETLKKAGAEEVWEDAQFGWTNQPSVVLFTGLSEEDAKRALNKLPVFEAWEPIISSANRHWH